MHHVLFRMKNHLAGGVACLAICALSSGLPAYAQSTVDPAAQLRARQEADMQQQRERLLRETQERQRQQSEPDARLPLPESEDISGTALPAEERCFPIARVVLDVPSQLPAHIRAAGASREGTDPFHFVLNGLEQYADRCIGHEGLNLIVKRLSARILAAGYTTTRISIPAQNLADGTLTLTLVPGVIRKIYFSTSDPYNSWKTAFPMREGDLLNIRDIEQGLEQMKRVSSQDAEMQIVPGDLPGESDIVIDLKRIKQWRVTLNLDDSGTKGTGKLQAGYNFAVDSPLGLNDLFAIGFNVDAEGDGEQRGTQGRNITYSVPYGYWTFGVAASSYEYHQKIAGLFQTFVSSGNSDDMEFKVQRLVQRDQMQKNTMQLRIGKRWSHAYVDDTEIEVQRSNPTFVELAWVHKHYLDEAQLDLTLANRWGASWIGGQSDLPGRTADSPTFRYTMQTIDATLVAPFDLAGSPVTYVGTLRAQTTSSPLYASEQFSIGNRYTVRGFDGEMTLSAEKGFFIRNELNLPLGNSGQSFYVGLDAGKVYGPNVSNLLGDALAGGALGLRGYVGGMNYDLFAGFAIHKPQNFPSDNPVFGFSLIYQF